MDDLVLAIDQGGQSTRAMLIAANGHVARTARRAVSTRRAETIVEQDAEEVLSSVQGCIAELCVNPTTICSAGLATQRSSLLAWDRDTLQPLTPVLSWQDRRAHAELEQLGLDPSTIRTTTGLQPTAHYGASKYQWLLSNESRVAHALLRGTLRMGPLASFLVAHLTDENSDLVDSANAQRTLLWSLAQRNWDSSLLQTFGVPREVLPICTSCVGNHGTLTIGNQQVPLVVVTGDQTAALHASGEETKECAWLNLGTGAFLQRRHDTPAPSGLLTNVEVTNEAKTQWTWEATVNGAGSALAMEAAALGLTDLEDKIEDGLRTETKIPIFLNGVSGLGSPYWVANFESRYLNDDGCSPEAKLVAVLESILFAIAMNLEIMERHGGPVALVEATGGLARSRALLERLAALIDRPVRRREDSEGTARGLAYLTLRHTLGAAPEDWNTSPVTLITPLPAPNLRERYQEYKRAIRKAVEGKGSSQA